MTAAVLVLFLLVLLRWGILLFGALLIVRPVRDCPACFDPTFRIRKPLLRLLTGRRFEWRWCPSCRWQGLARRVPEARAGPGERPRA